MSIIERLAQGIASDLYRLGLVSDMNAAKKEIAESLKHWMEVNTC